MRVTVIAALVFTCMFGTCVFAGEFKLPAPKKTGGIPVFEAIDHRGSEEQNGFPAGKVGQEELSTILWAASGLNRDGSKWTVPMAMGRPPYTKVYVLDDSGAYLYSWKNHSLIEVTKNNVKPEIALQSFAKTVPTILIFALDSEELGKFGDNPHTEEFGVLLVGSMSQNIYLASESVGVGARLVYSIDRDKAATQLKLNKNDKAICAVLLGKK